MVIIIAKILTKTMMTRKATLIAERVTIKMKDRKILRTKVNKTKKKLKILSKTYAERLCLALWLIIT